MVPTGSPTRAGSPYPGAGSKPCLRRRGPSRSSNASSRSAGRLFRAISFQLYVRAEMMSRHLAVYLAMDHRSSGDETREPIFRSDLEGPRQEPTYEPLRPEGGPWSVIKRWLAPLAAVGLLLAKFKSLALLLLKVKFLGTALTMLVSIGAYALLFPVWFAVGIVVL